MTLTLLPSPSVATVAWLKNQPDLIPLHGGRVGTKLNAALPAVRVQRIGGSPADTWSDRPLMQIECWAADEGAADRLSLAVVAALPTFRGDYASGRVWTYAVESGPYFSPDDPDLSNSVRYILTVRLLTSP